MFFIRVSSQLVIFYPLFITCVLIAKFPHFLPFFVLPNASSDTYTFSPWPLCLSLQLPSKLCFSAQWPHGTGFLSPSSTHPSLWGFHGTPTLRNLLPQMLVASQCCKVWCSSAEFFSKNVTVNWLAGRQQHCPTTEGTKLSCAWEQTSLAVTSWFTVLQAFWALVFVSILQWQCGLPCRKLKQTDNELTF